MSCVYKGSVIETELSASSNGGTEQMRKRLLKYANPDLLSKVAIHLSRPRQLYNDVPNILWCHDLASDPENRILKDGGWRQFDFFVFVSAWQRDSYISAFGIPYSKCTVIKNAIEKEYSAKQKSSDKIRFIYHTTPHRGLELLVPIFEELCKEFDNLHLDVFSSFGVYGWEQRDQPYQKLFDTIRSNKNMTYHGAKSNEEVLSALDNAHIFLYPCIWQETSCIALIEAIRSGCIAIHPNFGALSETGANVSYMYDYTEDVNRHAHRAYSMAKHLLVHIKNNPVILPNLSSSDSFELPDHNISVFTKNWNNVIEHAIGSKNG